jgi:hypothetical protein
MAPEEAIKRRARKRLEKLHNHIICVVGRFRVSISGVVMSQHSLSQEKQPNLIIRLWRGDVPLWKAYWLYGVLLGVIINVAVTGLLYQVYYRAVDFSAFDFNAISYLLLSALTLYSIVIFVGVWNSANNYKKLHPLKSRNATLAKIAVVLGALSFVSSVVKTFDASNNSIDAILKNGTPQEQIGVRLGSFLFHFGPVDA